MKSVGVLIMDIRHIASCKSAQQIQCLLMKSKPSWVWNGEELLPKSVPPKMSFHPIRRELMCQTTPLVNTPRTKTHLKWNLWGNFKENQKEWLKRDSERKIPFHRSKCNLMLLKKPLHSHNSSQCWKKFTSPRSKDSNPSSSNQIPTILFSLRLLPNLNDTSESGEYK